MGTLETSRLFWGTVWGSGVSLPLHNRSWEKEKVIISLDKRLNYCGSKCTHQHNPPSIHRLYWFMLQM